MLKLNIEQKIGPAGKFFDPVNGYSPGGWEMLIYMTCKRYGAKQTMRKGLFTGCFWQRRERPPLVQNKNI